MRDILFRGKTKGGAWLYGGIAFQEGEDVAIVHTLDYYNSLYDLGIEADYVIPETVGQFTGLLDKNRKNIFEGDIGRYKQTDGAKRNGKPIICTGKVIYNEKTASYAVESKDEYGVEYFDYFPIKDFEIIGNFIDNPELLAAEADQKAN